MRERLTGVIGDGLNRIYSWAVRDTISPIFESEKPIAKPTANKTNTTGDVNLAQITRELLELQVTLTTPPISLFPRHSRNTNDPPMPTHM